MKRDLHIYEKRPITKTWKPSTLKSLPIPLLFSPSEGGKLCSNGFVGDLITV